MTEDYLVPDVLYQVEQIDREETWNGTADHGRESRPRIPVPRQRAAGFTVEARNIGCNRSDEGSVLDDISLGSEYRIACIVIKTLRRSFQPRSGNWYMDLFGRCREMR